MRANGWWLGALVVGLAGAGQVARAQGPCAADVARLCGGVQPGGRAIVRCLKAHESELSPACQARRAAHARRMKAKMDALRAACGQDLQQFCSDIQPGGGRLVACLKAHGPDLSPACKAEGQKLKAERRERRRRVEAARVACEPDVQRLCGDVQRGQGRIIACMRAHANELSPGCRAAGRRLRQD